MKEVSKIDPEEFRNKPRDRYHFIGDGFVEVIQYLNELTDVVNDLLKWKEDHENAEGTQGTA